MPHPLNAPQTKAVGDIILEIEARHRDLLSEKMENARRCQPIHKAIKDLVDRAKNEQGLRPKALKDMVKDRDLRRKLETLGDNLEDEDASQFEYLREIFGDAAELPLFAKAADDHAEHAKEKAATGRRRKAAAKQLDLEDLTGPSDAIEDDPRPSFLKDRHDEAGAGQ